MKINQKGILKLLNKNKLCGKHTLKSDEYDMNLFNLGLDSINYVKFVVELEKLFEVEWDENDWSLESISINSIVNLLKIKASSV